jgi:adenosylhomocysteine nucleosidase
MATGQKVALVAALPREVWPVVRRWQSSQREIAGRRFRFFENQRAVLVCGGIGAEAARRAAEAVVQSFHPLALLSIGFAGSLESRLPVGSIVPVKQVIDVKDGSRVDMPGGAWVLASFDEVASPRQKARLAQSYGAHAVDMEAAAVARSAQAHGIPFLCVKAISDDASFEMPPLAGFVHPDGRFREAALAVHVALRPWLWVRTLRLARNSARAAQALCQWLDQYNHPAPHAGPAGCSLAVRAH